ncbi:MAG: hypothetical protein NT027_20520, partial [Proteobacteria bacterium]|nr:hypothetical protein [Pseudomonadota bacterium]
MKANIAFCCVALLGLLAALPVSASDCSNKLNTVVSPMADAESKPFIEWVAKQSKLGNDFFGSNSTKLYKIDINNDGVEEIVSESY